MYTLEKQRSVSVRDINKSQKKTIVKKRLFESWLSTLETRGAIRRTRLRSLWLNPLLEKLTTSS